MQNFFQRHLRRTLFGIFGATLLVGGIAACSHSGERNWGKNMTAEQYAERRDKVVDRAARKLELNAEQKQRLTQVGDALFAQRKALMGQANDPRAEVKALIAGAQFDAAKAQAMVNEKASVLQSKSPEVIATLAAFYDSLNPTQQQKVRDFMEGRHGWFSRG